MPSDQRAVGAYHQSVRKNIPGIFPSRCPLLGVITYLTFTLPYPTPPVLPYPTLPHPPFPTPPYLSLPYCTLPYPTLPYPTLP